MTDELKLIVHPVGLTASHDEEQVPYHPIVSDTAKLSCPFHSSVSGFVLLCASFSSPSLFPAHPAAAFQGRASHERIVSVNISCWLIAPSRTGNCCLVP